MEEGREAKEGQGMDRGEERGGEGKENRGKRNGMKGFFKDK